MKLPNLFEYDEISYDTETTGLNPMAGDRVFSFSIATEDKDLYFDLRSNQSYEVHDLGTDREELELLHNDFDCLKWINDQFLLYRGVIICHNLSFDSTISKLTGIRVPLLQSIDTCIWACLINEHEYEYSLDYLTKKYTSVRKAAQELYDKMAALFGGIATKNVQMARISQAPNEVVAPYACSDTRGTFELYKYQIQQIKKQNLDKIITFEKEITPILIDTELHGVAVDIPQAEMAVGELTAIIKQKQRELDKLAGFHCNPQPSKDIVKLFEPKWRDGRWWANDGTPLEETGAGKASVNADALRLMSHPAAGMILDLRNLIKTRDTFLVNHVLESAVDGRVYPTINQTKGDGGGTGTGRLSYAAPALQQIPDRNKEVAQIVKRVFLPDDGHVWVDADKASFEVRMFGHLVGTPDIVDAYRKDPETDFHQWVADLTGLVRNATYSGQPNAKQLNLSMIFNQGDGTTAEKMGLPWTWESFTPKGQTEEVVYKKPGEEAKRIIELYHNRLPGVKKLANGCKQKAIERGYIFTRHGRHLRFPKGYKSYKASGILIQATSADENKVSWKEITDTLDGTGGRLLLNTHDSYSMSLPEDRVEWLARKVKKAVEKDRGLRVPLILEVNQPGKNWWESKSSKRWM